MHRYHLNSTSPLVAQRYHVLQIDQPEFEICWRTSSDPRWSMKMTSATPAGYIVQEIEERYITAKALDQYIRSRPTDFGSRYSRKVMVIKDACSSRAVEFDCAHLDTI